MERRSKSLLIASESRGCRITLTSLKLAHPSYQRVSVWNQEGRKPGIVAITAHHCCRHASRATTPRIPRVPHSLQCPTVIADSCRGSHVVRSSAEPERAFTPSTRAQPIPRWAEPSRAVPICVWRRFLVCLQNPLQVPNLLNSLAIYYSSTESCVGVWMTRHNQSRNAYSAHTGSFAAQLE